MRTLEPDDEAALEMAAFDLLPPRIQAALRHIPTRCSAKLVAFLDMGIATEEQILAEILALANCQTRH